MFFRVLLFILLLKSPVLAYSDVCSGVLVSDYFEVSSTILGYISEYEELLRATGWVITDTQGQTLDSHFAPIFECRTCRMGAYLLYPFIEKNLPGYNWTIVTTSMSPDDTYLHTYIKAAGFFKNGDDLIVDYSIRQYFTETTTDLVPNVFIGSEEELIDLVSKNSAAPSFIMKYLETMETDLEFLKQTN